MRSLLTKKRLRIIVKYFNSEKGLKHIPYVFGTKFISWFCATDFATKEFFRNKTPIIREYLSNFPERNDSKKIEIEFLRLNFLHGWRSASFTNLSDRAYFRKLKFKGYDIFQDHYKAGKGVILLNSHYGLPSVAYSVFPSLGYQNFYTIIGERYQDSSKFSGLKAKRIPNVLSFERGLQSDSFALLFEAKKLLEEGGILHILGDGMHGKANVSIDFLGKLRGFRSTFAELGLIAGSAIIPIFTIPDKSGNMHLDFLEPLDQGDEDMDHTERVQMIVEQYSKILERKWKEHPQYINGGFVDVYNKQISIKN